MRRRSPGLKDEIQLESAPAGLPALLPETAPGAPARRRTPVSVIIPCYNEEETLPYLSNTLRSVEKKLSDSGYKADFVFVDDCSKDATHSRLTELFGSEKNVTILRHETNKGVAAGIMTGLNYASSEIVCSMDCDCTYDRTSSRI